MGCCEAMACGGAIACGDPRVHDCWRRCRVCAMLVENAFCPGSRHRERPFPNEAIADFGQASHRRCFERALRRRYASATRPQARCTCVHHALRIACLSVVVLPLARHLSEAIVRRRGAPTVPSLMRHPARTHPNSLTHYNALQRRFTEYQLYRRTIVGSLRPWPPQFSTRRDSTLSSLPLTSREGPDHDPSPLNPTLRPSRLCIGHSLGRGRCLGRAAMRNYTVRGGRRKRSTELRGAKPRQFGCSGAAARRGFGGRVENPDTSHSMARRRVPPRASCGRGRSRWSQNKTNTDNQSNEHGERTGH